MSAEELRAWLVEAVAAATGQKRRLVYQRALSLAKDTADGQG